MRPKEDPVGSKSFPKIKDFRSVFGLVSGHFGLKNGVGKRLGADRFSGLPSLALPALAWTPLWSLNGNLGLDFGVHFRAILSVRMARKRG